MRFRRWTAQGAGSDLNDRGLLIFAHGRNASHTHAPRNPTLPLPYWTDAPTRSHPVDFYLASARVADAEWYCAADARTDPFPLRPVPT